MAAAAIMRAWSYLEPGLTAPPNQLAFVGALIPVTAYAFVWLATGLTLILAVVWARLMPIAVAAFVGMHLLWALSFISSWMFLNSPRAWVSAISYVTLAGLGALVARMIDPPDVMTTAEQEGRE